MKKRLLSVLLAAAMVVSMAACGGSDDAANNDAANTEVAGTEAGNDTVDYGSGEIKIWVAENVVDFTKSQAETFLKSNEAFAGYTVVVEPVWPWANDLDSLCLK